MNPAKHDRVKGLLEGDWASAAAASERFLRPPSGLISTLLTQERISKKDLLTGERTHVSTAKSHEIGKVLRPHWKTRAGVSNPRQIGLRDSFDEALTLLQILELSVESGYLSEDAIRSIARQRLLELLWSKGARSFVKNYDYLGVRFLAARYEIDLGLGKVIPPEPDPRAQVQFATFLSQHQAWYGDEGLDWWLGLLDDYVADDDEFPEPEDEAFYSFLRSGKLPCESRTVQLRFYERADGLKRFLYLLSNLFSFLTPPVAPLYGLIYLYWMAKFFGYELNAKGYSRDPELYFDWSRVAAGPVLCAVEEPHDQKIHAARRSLIEQQIEIIRVGFKSTNSFVRRHL
jgi:hypothetical protein